MWLSVHLLTSDRASPSSLQRMHQYTSKFPAFPTNAFLPSVINGSEIMCFLSCPLALYQAALLVSSATASARGGSKVGSEATGAGLRVAHDAFLTGLQTAGDNLQLCGWRQGAGEGTQVWFHPLTCIRWNGDGGLWAAFASERLWKRWIFPPHMRFTSCSAGGKLLEPPCNQMWPYLGWLPAVVPASYDGWFILIRVFQYTKLNLTILNLVSNELGNPRGYSQPSG